MFNASEMTTTLTPQSKSGDKTPSAHSSASFDAFEITNEFAFSLLDKTTILTLFDTSKLIDSRHVFPAKGEHR
jgi:hypothetical protein